MHDFIQTLIKNFVSEYSKREGIKTRWKEPIAAYADAQDKAFAELKKTADPSHLMPQDILPGVKTVIAYFIPFEDYISCSNVDGFTSSQEWIAAYIETNAMILEINTYMKQELEKLGYTGSVIPATHNFDKEKLVSKWSHRHIAYIAGLGSFGINNMLITEKGCCGRFGSIVTDLKIEPTQRKSIENCVYKNNGQCRECVDRCKTGALTVNGFDRFKCYKMCLHNDKIYNGEESADVCGKCLAGVRCSSVNPMNV